MQEQRITWFRILVPVLAMVITLLVSVIAWNVVEVVTTIKEMRTNLDEIQKMQTGFSYQLDGMQKEFNLHVKMSEEKIAEFDRLKDELQKRFGYIPTTRGGGKKNNVD